jgi:hypothetical protein
MSSNNQNTKFRLTVKLDVEWDADIIEWIEAHPKGQRSEIVRSALRKSMQPEVSIFNPEDFRYIIADELDKALSGLHVQSLTPTGTTVSNDDAEAKYGDKLDRMLGNLGRR